MKAWPRALAKTKTPEARFAARIYELQVAKSALTSNKIKQTLCEGAAGGIGENKQPEARLAAYVYGCKWPAWPFTPRTGGLACKLL